MAPALAIHSTVSLVGWSLGGIYARTLARDTPSAVRQVITLGSPIHPRRRKPVPSRSHLQPLRPPARRADKPPLESGVAVLPVPATSIFSRYDGIVAWQACLDLPSARAENIAVAAATSASATTRP